VSLQAVDAIKSLIVSGQLSAGDALPPERDLAAMLGISRPSVREAIRVLAAMNVVQPRHGGGTFVTSLEPRLLVSPINFLLQIDSSAFLHLFEVRRVLEVGAARIAAPKMIDDAIADLEELADKATAALQRPAQYSELDFKLHTRIVEATGNPIYLSLYASIADLLRESRRRTVQIPAARRRAHTDHLAIVAALRARDADGAALAMHHHLEGMREFFQRLIERGEDRVERKGGRP
jgi:GntR family transcriptional repressor for pyruvate dehydrogenase complex